MLLVPLPFAMAGWRERRAGGGPAAALCGLWSGLVLANLVGNYPAPVVGFSASLLVGWLVSLGLIARYDASRQEPPYPNA